MDEVWEAPGRDEDAPLDKRPPAALGSEPLDVAKAVWADLSAHPVGYLTSGTGYFVAVMGLLAVSFAAVMLGMAPGLLLEDENLMLAGGMAGVLVYTALILGFSFALFPLMSAALIRALEAQRVGEGAIGFTSCFRGLTHRAVPTIVFYLMCQALVFIGMLCLYLPGIIAAVVTTFAFPIFVLDEEIRPVEALSKAWEHVKSQPAWHLVVWLTLFGALIAAELTVVGLLAMFPVMAAWQLYAHRVAFPEEAA